MYTLSKVIEKNGIFIDGDWIESKDQDPNGEVRLIQLADIGDGVFLNKSARYITFEKAKELKCTFLQKGDILIARMPDPLGRACIFPGDIKQCITAVDVCIVRPASNGISNDFLKYFINNKWFRNKINTYSTGTTRKRISRSNLDKISFTLPPLEDQIRIANLLSRIEELIAKRKESIRLLDEFVKSTFLEMFGDPVRNEKGWKKKELNKLGKISTGTTPSSSKNGMFGGNIPFVTPADLESNNDYKRYVTAEGAENSRVVRKGSTFVCCIGATIGKVDIAKNIASFNQQLNAVEWCDQINDLFGMHMMKFYKKIIISKGSASTTLPILNKSDFEKIQVIAPNNKLQDKFSEIVGKVESIKIKIHASYSQLENLYGSVSQRAFRGEM